MKSAEEEEGFDYCEVEGGHVTGGKAELSDVFFCGHQLMTRRGADRARPESALAHHPSKFFNFLAHSKLRTTTTGSPIGGLGCTIIAPLFIPPSELPEGQVILPGIPPGSIEIVPTGQPRGPVWASSLHTRRTTAIHPPTPVVG